MKKNLEIKAEPLKFLKRDKDVRRFCEYLFDKTEETKLKTDETTQFFFIFLKEALSYMMISDASIQEIYERAVKKYNDLH